MPAVYPFVALQYRVTQEVGRGDVSGLVAPPYDVLGVAEKAAMLARNPRNIVAADLPHVPAKELGPPAAYAAAADALAGWQRDGVLQRRETAAMFAYRQIFSVAGRRFERCGMACTVDTQPLGPRAGGGILPHEQTFSGPKEDRMALMKATRTQLSPIFGLYADASGRGTETVRAVMARGPADLTADLGDNVRHEVWTVQDPATIAAYAAALAGEDIFIADGHHRYNTAVNYLQWLQSQGDVPASHPARRTMFVMVGMSDPGLYIGPTHRVLGGMKHYSIDRFIDAAKGMLEIRPAAADPAALEAEMQRAAGGKPSGVLGLVDFATGRCFVATPSQPDPLAARFPDKPRAWRELDVALVQHLVVEGICRPALNDNADVKWAFPHSMAEVLDIGRGRETGAGGGGGFAQLAVIVRPTPIDAVREISRANELMPQKSTFFFPKLATGLFIHPLH